MVVKHATKVKEILVRPPGQTIYLQLEILENSVSHEIAKIGEV